MSKFEEEAGNDDIDVKGKEVLSQHKTSHSGGVSRMKVPSLKLDRVLPSVIRAATARESLRGMITSERRPYTGLYTSKRSCSAFKNPQHGSHTERIHTADSINSSLGQNSTSKHTLKLVPDARAVSISEGDVWGGETRLRARQDSLLPGDLKYSDVHVRLSNVCKVHLMTRNKQLQSETEAYHRCIYQSLRHENDSNFMVATKAHLTGMPIKLPKMDTKVIAPRVQGNRPPSESQSGKLLQFVFNKKSKILRNTPKPSQLDATPHFSTFLTESEVDNTHQITTRRNDKDEDEADGALTRRKRDDTELNEAIEARLKKVVPSVQPIVKSLGKVNFAITTWLKGGGRQVRILRNGDARLKNNFDPSGEMKSINNGSLALLQNMLQDQKVAISEPDLDLLLEKELPLKYDSVDYNKQFVDAFVPEVRNAQLLRQLVKRSQNVDKVQQRRQEEAQQKLKNIHLDLERKMPAAKKLACQLAEDKRELAIEFRQLMASIEAIKWLQQMREAVWLKRVVRFSMTTAAKKIQRAARLVTCLRMMTGTKQWAREKIRFWIQRVRRKMRTLKKPGAVETLKLFLRNCREMSKVMPAIKMFKYRVVQLQRTVKRWHKQVRASLLENTKTWERVEFKIIRHIWSLRDKQKKARATNKDVYKRLKEAEIIEKVRLLVAELGLPDQARLAAIFAFRKTRRNKYREEKKQYDADEFLYLQQFEHKELMIRRMIEFTGNTNVEYIVQMVDQVSTGQYAYKDKPKAPVANYAASEDEMLEVWWAAALRTMLSGQVHELKETLKMLDTAGFLDAATHRRFAQVARAERAASPTRTRGSRAASPHSPPRSPLRKPLDLAKDAMQLEVGSEGMMTISLGIPTQPR